MNIEKLKLQFYKETDSLLGGTFKDHVRDALWTWVEDKLSNQVQAVVKPEIALVSREFCGHLIKNINEAHEKIRTAPELNPSNYTHKEAMQLNDDMIEAFGIIDETLFLIKKNLQAEFAEYESKISG